MRRRRVWIALALMAALSSACTSGEGGSGADGPVQATSGATTTPVSRGHATEGCTRGGVSLRQGLTFGTNGYFVTNPELVNRSRSTISVTGFPSVVVLGTGRTPHRIDSVVRRSGTSGRPIRVEPAIESFPRGPSVRIRVGADVTDGTEVHDVTVGALRLSFAGLQCTVALDDDSLVSAPIGDPIVVTVSAWESN